MQKWVKRACKSTAQTALIHPILDRPLVIDSNGGSRPEVLVGKFKIFGNFDTN